jgi:Acyl-CoA reductase (LuxC)
LQLKNKYNSSKVANIPNFALRYEFIPTFIKIMKLQERILLFATLGKVLESELEAGNLEELLYAAKSKNAWFTIDNLKLSLSAICQKYLNEKVISDFCKQYEISEVAISKKVGIVAAGNIPLVAFQDILHTILMGHAALVKPSSQDELLLRFLYSKMTQIDARVEKYFEFADRINAAEAYIATGSGNTSRYFEYYFASKPHIIRKNRTSLAVLDGTETKIEIANLANDIFMYFGLGCRNVSKLLVPKGYDFEAFFKGIEYWNTVSMHSKYNNNYEYMKAIYLVNRELHLDNGFLLLKENSEMASPISVLFYSFYENISEVKDFISVNAEKIQLVCSKNEFIKNKIPFGASQEPNINDFADGVNTVEFLKGI